MPPYVCRHTHLAVTIKGLPPPSTGCCPAHNGNKMHTISEDKRMASKAMQVNILCAQGCIANCTGASHLHPNRDYLTGWVAKKRWTHADDSSPEHLTQIRRVQFQQASGTHLLTDAANHIVTGFTQKKTTIAHAECSHTLHQIKSNSGFQQ